MCLQHLGPVARLKKIFLKIINDIRSCYDIDLFACYLSLSFCSEDTSHSTLTIEELIDRWVVVEPSLGPVTLDQSKGSVPGGGGVRL